MSRTLYLPLKREYFNAIKEGRKVDEYRLVTPHWVTRLVGRNYDRIILTLGYPKLGDTSRIIERPWLGYEVKTITHEHFGVNPVTVFAIKVN